MQKEQGIQRRQGFGRQVADLNTTGCRTVGDCPFIRGGTAKGNAIHPCQENIIERISGNVDTRQGTAAVIDANLGAVAKRNNIDITASGTNHVSGHIAWAFKENAIRNEI